MDSTSDPQAPLDWFTDLDRKLDETNELLGEVVKEQSKNGSALSDIASQLGADADTSPNREFVFDLSTSVPADTPEIDPLVKEVEIPYDGRINRVLIGFPNGAQQAVGVQVGTAGSTWIPRGSADDPPYIGFDNHVITIDLNEEIRVGNPVQARFINNDTTNSHFLNVDLLVEEF